MATRPLVAVYSSQTGEVTANKVPTPAVFQAPIRLDIVNFVHTNLSKNRRQAHGVDPRAGHKHSAESWGTGRAVSRIPRVSGSGTHRSGQAAFGNMCRSGRMFAPLHVWRRWNRRVNIKQKRHAVASAVAASGIVPLVLARGHKIGQLPELPLVLDNAFGTLTKTKDAVNVLKRLGVFEDVIRVVNGKKTRAGKGKLRNRRYTHKKGPLVVVDDNQSTVTQALRNVPGVDVLNVNRLSLSQLAPGGQLGRLVVWTQDAFSKLNQVFGTYRYDSQLKEGYTLNRAILSNPDIARVINSNEIQTAVKPAKAVTSVKTRKRNPLTNKKAMSWINPNYTAQSKATSAAIQANTQNRSKLIAEKRAALTKDQKKAVNQQKQASRSWLNSLRATQNQADNQAVQEEDEFRKLDRINHVILN